MNNKLVANEFFLVSPLHKNGTFIIGGVICYR